MSLINLINYKSPPLRVTQQPLHAEEQPPRLQVSKLHFWRLAVRHLSIRDAQREQLNAFTPDTDKTQSGPRKVAVNPLDVFEAEWESNQRVWQTQGSVLLADVNWTDMSQI